MWTEVREGDKTYFVPQGDRLNAIYDLVQSSKKDSICLFYDGTVFSKVALNLLQMVDLGGKTLEVWFPCYNDTDIWDSIMADQKEFNINICGFHILDGVSEEDGVSEFMKDNEEYVDLFFTGHKKYGGTYYLTDGWENGIQEFIDMKVQN